MELDNMLFCPYCGASAKSRITIAAGDAYRQYFTCESYKHLLSDHVVQTRWCKTIQTYKARIAKLKAELATCREEPNIIPELCDAIRDLLGTPAVGHTFGGKYDLSGIGHGKVLCCGCGRAYNDRENLSSLCPAEDCPRHKARALLAKAELL